MFFFYYVVSHDFSSKLIINVASNNHIILLLYEENIYIWYSSWKEDVKFSPAINILKSSPEERYKSLTSHHLMWSFFLLLTVMSSLFLCLLLKRKVEYSKIETGQLTLEAWWINTYYRGFTPF